MLPDVVTFWHGPLDRLRPLRFRRRDGGVVDKDAQRAQPLSKRIGEPVDLGRILSNA